MKLILGFSVLFLSVVASAGPCEELIKKIDPKASAQYPIVTVGQLKFNFLTPMANPASSCSMTVSHVNQKRRFAFMDDGSFSIQTDVSAGKRTVTKGQSFFLLPQEKGKNFSVARQGNLITLKMNAGDFTFDTSTGKMLSNSSVTVQDTETEVNLAQPKGLLVNFGVGMGSNPRDTATSVTLMHRGATCQFPKAKFLKPVVLPTKERPVANYDRDIIFKTSGAQVDFFKKSCPGMKMQIPGTQAAAASSEGSQSQGILNPEFEKTIQNLQDQAR